MQHEAARRAIKIAVLAMGGEGGGVLVDWIVTAADRAGYWVQSTSVPGVAQRTGATIYYVEILPQARDASVPPVLALMPTPGDVDVVVASELMEAARAVQRGLVTPDRTLLIASAHRVYALPEKMAMGDGRVDSDAFRKRCEEASRDFICGDFAAIAEQAGSVISASLFGALAGAGALPWGRDGYEDAIRQGGVGVANSLKAFERSFDQVQSGQQRGTGTAPGATTLDPRLGALGKRVDDTYPAAVAAVLRAGLTRTADYQSLAYAQLYLDRLELVRDLDRRHGDGSYRMTREVGRYLALWMTYEDTVRVAELKIRKSRFDRVQREVGGAPDQVVRINEYFHPRVEEIADTLPARAGTLLLEVRWLRALVKRIASKGRIVRTSSLGGFMLLYALASLKRTRPGSLRYRRETKELLQWLQRLSEAAARDYELACEIAECQRLVKGYGSTHARGTHSFHTIMEALPSLPSTGAAEWVRRLREAALSDDSGAALDRLIASVPTACKVDAAESPATPPLARHAERTQAARSGVV